MTPDSVAFLTNLRGRFSILVADDDPAGQALVDRKQAARQQRPATAVKHRRHSHEPAAAG